SHKPGDYEVDHIISLELGGSNDIKNLWPQPYHGLWNAHMKDKLENKLNEMVKTNQIELADAQKAISTDWVGAYLKYVDPNSDGTH
ncbi:HNH endonuclease, partial [Streptomyces niveiscabiei]|uniref:HNH endonuclease n=1 Tax=Streptomyces niveiscabiei TaxID=164115 RepID=UPI0038F703D6